MTSKQPVDAVESEQSADRVESKAVRAVAEKYRPTCEWREEIGCWRVRAWRCTSFGKSLADALRALEHTCVFSEAFDED